MLINLILIRCENKTIYMKISDAFGCIIEIDST